MAETIHELQPAPQAARSSPLNCGAISPNLIESELFGHERGSFTGADRSCTGATSSARNGGTLFLDEITEMPIELQVKLLRVLETGTVMRVGGERSLPVDVRVDRRHQSRSRSRRSRDGKLREDLLYRLNVFPIALPPLRERGGRHRPAGRALPRRAQRGRGHAQASRRAAPSSGCARYRWPGNVRELKNVMHRAFILADEEIDAELPARTTWAARRGGGRPRRSAAPVRR